MQYQASARNVAAQNQGLICFPQFSCAFQNANIIRSWDKINSSYENDLYTSLESRSLEKAKEFDDTNERTDCVDTRCLVTTKSILDKWFPINHRLTLLAFPPITTVIWMFILTEQNLISTMSNVCFLAVTSTVTPDYSFRPSVSCVRLESREYDHRNPSRWPRGTLYPQKLALTSATSSASLGRYNSLTDSSHRV
jgi:hypothetical protein